MSLVEIVEVAIFSFFLYFCPGVIGFLMGRVSLFWLRFLPHCFILPIGYDYIQSHAHGFEFLVIGILGYVLGCIEGLMRRSKVEGKQFWDYHHVDWMSLLVFDFYSIWIYIPPIQ